MHCRWIELLTLMVSILHDLVSSLSLSELAVLEREGAISPLLKVSEAVLLGIPLMQGEQLVLIPRYSSLNQLL
jgi:hypothetical protein